MKKKPKEHKDITIEDLGLTAEEMEAFAQGARFLFGQSEDPINGPALDLAELNARHERKSDKYFRIYSGAASKLTGFASGILQLDIHVDNRLRLPLEQIVHNMAKSWRSERELKSATDYVAQVYKTEKQSGLTFSIEDISSPEGAAELVRLIKDIPEAYPDVLITKIEGRFDDE